MRAKWSSTSGSARSTGACYGTVDLRWVRPLRDYFYGSKDLADDFFLDCAADSDFAWDRESKLPAPQGIEFASPWGAIADTEWEIPIEWTYAKFCGCGRQRFVWCVLKCDASLWRRDLRWATYFRLLSPVEDFFFLLHKTNLKHYHNFHLLTGLLFFRIWYVDAFWCFSFLPPFVGFVWLLFVHHWLRRFITLIASNNPFFFFISQTDS